MTTSRVGTAIDDAGASGRRVVSACTRCGRSPTPPSRATSTRRCAALAGDVTWPLARHVVSEMHRVDAATAMLRANRPAALGALLGESHTSLREDFAVSCRELDAAVDAAVAAGALGARMIGGGFGGAAIALVPAGVVAEVAAAVDGALVAADLTRPTFLLAHASGPASRVA